MNNYDVDERTPTRVVLQKLRNARAERRIYVIFNLVRILRLRGRADVLLSFKEGAELLHALKLVRGGKKVLVHWLPIGYQIARLLFLAKILSVRNVRVTRRDEARIKRAARHYRKLSDWHSKRQLHSLILTAKYLGLKI